MWWFRDSLDIRWCRAPQQIAVLFAVVLLVVRRDSLHVTPQASSTIRKISCNAKQLNVQLERLMFYKDVCTLYHSTVCMCAVLFDITLHHPTLRWAISHNATPFVCTLYQSTLRWAISRNATLFLCTLYHSTLRRAISRNATPFVCTPYHSTLRWAIQRNATPFVGTLYHSTLRWTISRNATLFVRKPCYPALPWAISRNATPFVYYTANEY